MLTPQTQWFVVAAVALIAGAALGAVSMTDGLIAGRSDAATAPPAPPPPGMFRPTDAQWGSLKFAPVRRIDFPTENSTEGKIASDDDATTPVFSPYSGRVAKLFARAGDYVKAGAPLLAVDASEFVQGQNDLITAASGLATAWAQLRLARTSEERQRALYNAQGGALKDWQQSQVDLATAEGNYRSAQIALTAVRNRLRILGKSPAEITALENARARLPMTPEAIVTAPIAGTVTQRQVGIGQYINSAANGAANPVFSISDTSKVWLLADVPGADAPSMRVGEPVAVRVLAIPGHVFKAKVTYVASALDPNTHRLPVRAEVENPGGALKAEMFADFSIVTGSPVAALAVPEEAVVYEGRTARVWIVGQGKSLGLREIRTGRTWDGMVEVLSGLTETDTVVSSGSLFIDRAAQSD